jgi:hypothetical protein
MAAIRTKAGSDIPEAIKKLFTLINKQALNTAGKTGSYIPNN